MDSQPRTLPGLTPVENQMFEAGLEAFNEIDSVSGKEPGIEGSGLGPRFNSNSCVSCHAYPGVGGSSPPNNPLVHLSTQFGARNQVPFFITPNGPIREVRFRYKPDGTRDGGVHNVFVITGRADAGECQLRQPDFNAEAAKRNLSYRIPTPLFGLGLIEAIPDATILQNKTANSFQKLALGIRGHENRNGNDGTITRFGWKAQNKSLTLFAAEAYAVEQGVTNEIFPTEREESPACIFNATPEDHIHPEAPNAVASFSDVTHFANFMRFLAPLQPTTPLQPTAARGLAAETASAEQLRQLDTGKQLFVTIGCASCHTEKMMTGKSTSPSISEKPAFLYSDLLLHQMGPGLADDIIQGTAGPDEFRTAPLWGLGRRLFFLHDGRASTLEGAIQQHASGKRTCWNSTSSSVYSIGSDCASEANGVVSNYNALTRSNRGAVIQFLKSL